MQFDTELDLARTFFKIVRNAFIIKLVRETTHLFLITYNPTYMIKLVDQWLKIQSAPARRAQNIPVPLQQDGSDSFWVGTFCPSSGNWRNHGWTWNLNLLPALVSSLFVGTRERKSTEVCSSIGASEIFALFVKDCIWRIRNSQDCLQEQVSSILFYSIKQLCPNW